MPQPWSTWVLLPMGQRLLKTWNSTVCCLLASWRHCQMWTFTIVATRGMWCLHLTLPQFQLWCNQWKWFGSFAQVLWMPYPQQTNCIRGFPSLGTRALEMYLWRQSNLSHLGRSFPIGDFNQVCFLVLRILKLFVSHLGSISTYEY